MARLPRYALPRQPQHVVQRGTNRCTIFAAPADYETFRNRLGDACRQYECHVHAYVLMTNHVHLLITPQTTTGIPRVMQSVSAYAQYFNKRYERTGALWQGRYRATPIDTERYLFACYRYIELNPVRAGLVETPGAYPWSSYRANALGQPDQLITPHPQFTALGSTIRRRTAHYRALFQTVLDGRTVQDIRDAVNGAWALGGVEFCAKLLARHARRPQPLPPGPRPGHCPDRGLTPISASWTT